MCARLKAADRRWLARLAARVWQEAVARATLRTTFGAGVVLVPVPGSASAPGAPWAGERLAWCLREIGLAAAVHPALRRRQAVRKSAFAPAGERPSVLEHYESFAIEPEALGGRETAQGPLRLVLVDDVVTRGRTLLAAAMRLREAFPAAEVRAFALLRTLMRGEPLRQILDPCEGEVRWLHGDARRWP